MTPADLWQQCQDQLGPIFELMDMADDEIAEAQARHPESADLLYHGFKLLCPAEGAPATMRTWFVFRSHCRELLERVAAWPDSHDEVTPWPTNAELVAHICEASQQAPLTTAATTLYMRAWKAAFPDRPEAFDVLDGGEHYEHVAGGRADTLASTVRGKLRQPERRIRVDHCPGRHHGEPAPSCRFYRPEQLSLDVAL